MTHIYFIRHAEPDYSVHEDRIRPLTEKGLRDRELVTAFLVGQAVDVVLSSPYQRAVDTVKHLADSRGLAVVPVEDFRERKIDGWIEDFDAFSRMQWADFAYKRGSGESLGEVQNRNVQALQRVLSEYADKTVVIGSHGTALSTIVNHYQPRFGYVEFERIKGLLPWVVHFTFEGQECRRIEEFDLFERTSNSLMHLT